MEKFEPWQKLGYSYKKMCVEHSPKPRLTCSYKKQLCTVGVINMHVYKKDNLFHAQGMQ